MSRRKYEPAGGVVALEWKRGAPSSNQRYQVVVAEVWSATLDWQLSEVDVRARLVMMKWDADKNDWADVGGKIRRHAILGSCYAHLRLTLEAWPR